MKQNVEITVPTDYSAIPLKKYLQIQDDLKNYGDDTEAMDAFLLYHLCGLTPDVASQLDIDTATKIKLDLYKLLNKQDYELQRTIKIDGVEYGFEPNLSEMSYGAYLDVSKFETLSIDKNWATILSILYRPVVKKIGVIYQIEPYNGLKKGDEDKWYKVPMDFHFGCFFFFNRIYKDLLNAIQKSLREEALTNPTLHPYIQQILQESGEVINQLQSSQEKT